MKRINFTEIGLASMLITLITVIVINKPSVPIQTQYLVDAIMIGITLVLVTIGHIVAARQFKKHFGSSEKRIIKMMGNKVN